jgi:hypothetical protein
MEKDGQQPNSEESALRRRTRFNALRRLQSRARTRRRRVDQSVLPFVHSEPQLVRYSDFSITQDNGDLVMGSFILEEDPDHLEEVVLILIDHVFAT